MRDTIRRWLGFELDLRTRDEMIRQVRASLQELHDGQGLIEEAVSAAHERRNTEVIAALDRIHSGLCGNLNMIGEHLANLNGAVDRLADSAEKYVVACDPAIEDPIVCPNDHKGCMVVATLEDVDAKTLARRVSGYGIYCPKCQSSFYYHNGHRWSVAGSSVEVDKGVPTDTPKGTHREPELKRRPLRFRG